MSRNKYNNLSAPECKSYARFLLNMSANEQSTLGFIVGFLLSQDLSPMEQQALGNFIMLLSQVMITISAQNMLVQNRLNPSNNQNPHTPPGI